MKNRYRFLRKSYAMNRMAAAIERAIEARTIKEKERAARWAAAWGLLCGIKTRPVNVKRSEIGQLRALEEQLASLGFPEIGLTPGEQGAASYSPAPKSMTGPGDSGSSSAGG